jgi:ACT domain-containing protein
MKKEIAIVTTIGLDRTGIVSNISKILAENNVNIEDVSQTLLDKYFAMIMLVDISKSKLDIGELQMQLSKKGLEMNLDVKVQHENVFKSMHRI